MNAINTMNDNNNGCYWWSYAAIDILFGAIWFSWCHLKYHLLPMFISLRINLVLLFSQYSVYITIFDCLVFVAVIVMTGHRAGLWPLIHMLNLESDRYWWSLVLDNGTPERPWPITRSMCSKARWFRARNSVDRGVAAPLPSNSLLVARAGNVELDRYPQPMLLGAEVR